MRWFLVIILAIGAAAAVLFFSLNKTNAIKPILPAAFFEGANLNQIDIDFGACSVGQELVSRDNGRVNVQIWDFDAATCRMDLEMTVDRQSPAPSGLNKRDTKSCLIPKNTGSMTFNKTDTGVDFSGIDQYCKGAPKLFPQNLLDLLPSAK